MMDTEKTDCEFIGYYNALKVLSKRLKATPEEVAAWVWLGPVDGLNAFKNANEIDPPPPFLYGEIDEDEHNYLEPLIGCWFKKGDLEDFQPKDRFITGKGLIDRWEKTTNGSPETFIHKLVGQTRLMPIHPITGGTEWDEEDAGLPPKEIALFELADVEIVEKEEFLSQSEKDQNTPPLDSGAWREQNARKAANTRHSQPGGSRDKRKKMLERFLSGDYKTKSECIEKNREELGMSRTAGERALRNIPNPRAK